VQNTALKLHPNHKEPSSTKIQTTRAREATPVDVGAVLEYADASGLPAEHASAFFDHFEAAGWRMGTGAGRPVKDWQAAYRNWCRRAPQFDRTQNGPKNGHALTAAQRGSLNYDEQLEGLGYKPSDFGR